MTLRLVVIDPSDGTLVVITPENPRVRDIITAAFRGVGFDWAELGGTLVSPSEPEQKPSPSSKVKAKARYRKTKRVMRKRCPECGELFSRKGLGPHMIGKHKKWLHGAKVMTSGRARTKAVQEEEKGGTKLKASHPVPCPVCGTSFKLQGLVTHIKMKHPEEAKAASKVAAEDSANESRVNSTEQYLRDLVAGRKSIPQTSIGQAMVEAAAKAQH